MSINTIEFNEVAQSLEQTGLEATTAGMNHFALHLLADISRKWPKTPPELYEPTPEVLPRTQIIMDHVVHLPNTGGIDGLGPMLHSVDESYRRDLHGRIIVTEMEEELRTTVAGSSQSSVSQTTPTYYVRQYLDDTE